MNKQNGQVTAAQVLSLFGKGGVIILGRHGNALKATPGQIDRERALSPKGEFQVASMAKVVKQTMTGREFDLIMASPAERARHTACVATGCSREELGTVTTLAISEDKKEPLNVMFETLMYAPISEYFKHEHAEHLRELGRKFLAEIVSSTAGVMAARQDSNGTAKVFIGGHADEKLKNHVSKQALQVPIKTVQEVR